MTVNCLSYRVNKIKQIAYQKCRITGRDAKEHLSIMNDQFFTDEQWSELSQAIDLFDQSGDRTVLNRVLGTSVRLICLAIGCCGTFVLLIPIVSVLQSLVEELDDDNDMENHFVIASIESELAEIINGTSSYLCSSSCF